MRLGRSSQRLVAGIFERHNFEVKDVHGNDSHRVGYAPRDSHGYQVSIATGSAFPSLA